MNRRRFRGLCMTKSCGERAGLDNLPLWYLSVSHISSMKSTSSASSLRRWDVESLNLQFKQCGRCVRSIVQRGSEGQCECGLYAPDDDDSLARVLDHAEQVGEVAVPRAEDHHVALLAGVEAVGLQAQAAPEHEACDAQVHARLLLARDLHVGLVVATLSQLVLEVARHCS
jgi:hypothetical protein